MECKRVNIMECNPIKSNESTRLFGNNVINSSPPRRWFDNVINRSDKKAYGQFLLDQVRIKYMSGLKVMHEFMAHR